MKFLTIQLFLLTLFTFTLVSNEINLTQQEKEFIKNNPKIQVGMMPDFTPFTYIVDDKIVGFEHDLLKIISKRTGLEFEKTMAKWTKIYNAFKAKEIDMITSISYKKERVPFTNYTSSYYDIPIMIFVRDDFGKYTGLKSLEGKKVGVLKDVFYSKNLQDMGSMNLIIFETYEELTKALVFGRIDALVQNLTNINYLIKKNVYTNLKLADELKLDNIEKEDLRFGIQPQKPILASILQKALNSITKEEKDELSNKWIGTIKQYGGGHIELDEIETAYLDTKVIRYCIDPNRIPFEYYDQNNNHKGMSADYLNLFQKMFPAKYEMVKTTSSKQSLEYIKKNKCDILTLTMETIERKKYLNFTSHYLEVPLVIATKLDVPFISNHIELEGKKIAIPKDYANKDMFKNKYPSLNILEVESIDEGLDKVSRGEIFAYIGTLSSIGYKLQTKYFGELKITGKLSQTWKLGIGVRNDDPMLLEILQKVVNNITNEQHREIFNKWIAIKYEKGIDYNLVWKVIGISTILILLFAYWNRKISNTNKLLKTAHIEIEIKNKELEKLAKKDSLTDTYNRAKLEEFLETEINRSERFHHLFGISIVDIDHFKKINDTFGHQTGDKVLIEIANILKIHTRKTDFVARFGGEEFVIIFPESNQEEIYQIIEKLRITIEHSTFFDVEQITASFGITLYQKNDTIKSLIKRADTALYEAKNKGRNKVIIN